MQARLVRDRRAFERALHQVDAAARTVEVVAQYLVRRARGGAKAAVHALAQDCLGLASLGRVANKVRELGLHDGYTFRMRALAWFVVLAAIVGIVTYLVRLRRQWAERQDAAEARMMSIIAEVHPTAAAPLAAAPVVLQPAHAPQERLLFDAAGKAGEAGEPVLSIQLYAKLVSRFPQSSFAAPARAAVEEQKKKLAKT